MFGFSVPTGFWVEQGREIGELQLLFQNFWGEGSLGEKCRDVVVRLRGC